MTEPAKATAGEAVCLQLHWRQTWPDTEADYAAEAVGYPDSVGRIYIGQQGLQEGQWLWAMNAHGPEISRNIGTTHGVEASARAAAHKVEQAWFAAIKGSSLERFVPEVNLYAMAKGRE